MNGPCLDHVAVAHIIIAVFSGVSSVLGVYLTYRSRVQQRERRLFYRQMREKHGLMPDQQHAVGRNQRKDLPL